MFKPPLTWTLAELAKALNGTHNGKWVNIRGPAHSANDRSLGFMPDPKAPDGFAVHSLAEDNPKACRKHVNALIRKVANGAAIRLRAADDCSPNRQARISYALHFWDEATPYKGTLVQTYLASRACDFSTCDPEALRFHSSCRFGRELAPAMIALMRDSITGVPTGIHRTALRDDGSGKRFMPKDVPVRMMLGAAAGAAVQLAPIAPCMGIAEGIETALSARRIFEVPVWALLSAVGVSGFPVLPGIQHLTIFADHDEPGFRAARSCAGRYRKAGIASEIRYPLEPGSDWNDYQRMDHK